MATSSELRGLCFAPFFAESAFPETGGCKYPHVQHNYPRMVTDLLSHIWALLYAPDWQLHMLLALSDYRLDLP
jgi:hypothetical protein